MDGLEQTYGGRLTFERVDYTSARGQALARRFLVRAHPTVLVIDRAGQVVASLPGVPRREQVAAAIEVAAAR